MPPGCAYFVISVPMIWGEIFAAPSSADSTHRLTVVPSDVFVVCASVVVRGE
jgi:hypothetical protein